MKFKDILNQEFKTSLPDDFFNLWKKKVTLKRNDFLVQKGQLSPFLFFVKKGSLRIFYPAQEENFTIRFGYQYSFIGALTSFLNNSPAMFSIQAIKSAELIGISRNDFLKAMENHKILKDFWTKRMEQLVVEQLEREIDLLTPSPLERYNRVLERSPQLFQKIPMKYIASYLRMTPETLSRLRNS